MANPNLALEKLGYLIETTPGTKKIIAAGNTTYGLGMDLDGGGDWMQPSIKRNKDVAHSYNSREPASSVAVIDPATMSAEIKGIIPTILNPWYLLFGSGTDAATDTMQVKDTGLKKAITLHGEHNSGTTPFTRDLVGAYLNDMSWHMELAKPLIIDSMKFQGWSIQDEDSTVASIHLTNDPTIDQDKLPFIGINEIKWDTVGDNETLSRVYRVDSKSNHDITSTPVTGSGANAARKVYPGKFGTRTTTGHKFFMSAVLDTHNQYDDLRDGNQINVTFKSEKADGSDYVKFLYGGVDILDITKPIPRGGGYSERIITCEANTLSLEFDDGVTTFATMYP